MSVAWIISAVVSIIIIAALILIGKKIVRFFSNIKTLISKVDNIETAMGQIAESKRLSTIFEIEDSNVDIKNEELKPERDKIRNQMLTVLEESTPIYGGRKGDPDTWAFVILNHSGFDSFVNGDSRGKAKKVLARLLANGNMSAAKRFISMLARRM